MCKKLQKCLFILAAISMALRTTSCIPTRSQFNGMINSSIINGIELAITTAISNAFTPPTTTTTGT